MPGSLIAARTSESQVQTFFAIDSSDAFVIITPAFAPEQDLNARHAVPDTRRGDLFDSLSDGTIISAVRFVVNQRPRQQTERCGSFDRDAILVDQLLH